MRYDVDRSSSLALTQTNDQNIRVQMASATVGVVLVAAKLWALAVTGSLSVAASLADSAMDLMVSVAGLAAIRYARRPPDDDHTFGHSSAEELAALAQSIFILVSAVAIAGAALTRIDDTPARAPASRSRVCRSVSRSPSSATGPASRA